jgi:hypothetical protein
VSPYPFETAQAHYEALLEETRGAAARPSTRTRPCRASGPAATCIPARTPGNQYWFRMRHVQIPTILSLLTPEYQTRMVQEAYHHGNTNKAAVAVAVLLAGRLHAALARVGASGSTTSW